MAKDAVTSDVVALEADVLDASLDVIDLRDDDVEVLSVAHRAVREFRLRVGVLATIEDPVILANLAQALLSHAGSR